MPPLFAACGTATPANTLAPTNAIDAGPAFDAARSDTTTEHAGDTAAGYDAAAADAASVCTAASRANYSDDTCRACVSQRCCEPITALESSAERTPFIRCTSACRSDIACIRGCYASHPDISRLQTAATSCQTQNCAADCAQRAMVVVHNLSRAGARFCGVCPGVALVSSEPIATGAATQMRFNVQSGELCSFWFVAADAACGAASASAISLSTAVLNRQLPKLALVQSETERRLAQVPVTQRSASGSSQEVWLWNATGNPVEIIDVVVGGGAETIAARLRAAPEAVWTTPESGNGLYTMRGQLSVASANGRSELTLPPGQNCMLYFEPQLQGPVCAYR